MRRQRSISIFMMIMMCVWITSGCNKGETISETEEAQDKTPITFTFYSTDGQEDPWTDPVALEITKATGVTLKTEYPVNGGNSKITLMIASGEYPDLIYAKGDGVTLIQKGALIDLTDLIEEYGPNIKKLYGDYYSRLKYTEDDPSIYQLSSSQVGNLYNTTSGTAQLQWAVLKYNNYEIPYTLEQYENQIKNYMAAYPTINGNTTLGMSISCSDWRWYITLANPSGFINGYPDNGQWVVEDDEDYTAYYKHVSTGQYEYYKWLNRMYNEGVLDPEFATQQYEDYMSKIAEGRVLGLLDADWDYEDAVMILKSSGQYDRAYAALPVTMNEEVVCTSLYDQGLASGWGVAVTKSCKDPERMVQFLDWLCSDEAQILMNWGIEGVNYEIDETGMRYITEEEQLRKDTDIYYEKETGVGFHTYPFPRYGDGVEDDKGDYYTTTNKATTIKNYNDVENAALKAWGVETLLDIFPSTESFGKISPYGAVYQWSKPSELLELENTLDALSNKYLVDVIICGQNEYDSLWQEFQEELKRAGVDEAGVMLTKLVHEKIEFWAVD